MNIKYLQKFHAFVFSEAPVKHGSRKKFAPCETKTL